MKKHLWIFIMLLGWAGMAFAQGGRISYQAVVRDGGNELVRNTAVSVTVEVYDAADALAYREQHNATTNQNGLLSILVGGGTPEAGSWENIPWSRAWFRVQASVGNLTLTDTVAVGVVPSARYASELNPQAAVLGNFVTPGQLDNTLGQYLKEEALKAALHDTAQTLRGEAAAAHDELAAKMKADSAALAAQLRADSSDLAALIAADSSLLRDRMGETVRVLTARTAADSATLTAKKNANREALRVHAGQRLQQDVAPAYSRSNAALQAKLVADSTALLAKLRQDSVALTNQLRTDSADVAGEWRTDSTGLRQLLHDDSLATENRRVAVTAALTGMIDGVAGDLGDLQSRVNTFNANVCDSVKTCVNGQIHAAANTLRTNVADSTKIMHFRSTRGLKQVAGTGNYNHLSDRPTLADFDNDAGFISNADCDSLDYCQLMAKVNGIADRLNALKARQDAQRDAMDELVADADSTREAVWPTLTVSSTHESLCIASGSTAKVTYTAALVGDDLSRYAIVWKVDGSAQSGATESTMEMTYTGTAATHEVVCTLSRPNAEISDTVQTVVTVPSAVPVISFTSQNNTSTYNLDKSTITAVSNVSTASWYNAKGELVGNYKTANTDISFLKGTYTVEMTNSEGCVATQTVELLHTSCTVNGDLYASESGVGAVVDSVQDHQGNWYDVVQIGSQCWLKENMRCTTTPNGRLGTATSISTGSTSTPYFYENNFHPEVRRFGYLYNWDAAMDTTGDKNISPTDRRGICPEGWHIPTRDEWRVLYSNTIGTSISSNYTGNGTVKLVAGDEWKSNNTTNTPGDKSASNRNESRFSALCTGRRETSAATTDGNSSSYIQWYLQSASFWTAGSSNSTTNAYYEQIEVGQTGVYRTYSSKAFGRSVRCVRNS